MCWHLTQILYLFTYCYESYVGMSGHTSYYRKYLIVKSLN